MTETGDKCQHDWPPGLNEQLPTLFQSIETFVLLYFCEHTLDN